MKKLFLLTAFLLAVGVTSHTFAQEPHKGTSATLLAINQEVNTVDDRVIALENVLNKYNSPLAPHARTYVEYADKHGVDWKLLPAIAGLESTFGKFLMPGSHNAYGWGGGHIYFADWEEGIDVINKALRQNYMDKWGTSDVWEIGPIYAESKTWSVRVNSFMNEIEQEYFKIHSSTLPLTI